MFFCETSIHTSPKYASTNKIFCVPHPDIYPGRHLSLSDIHDIHLHQLQKKKLFQKKNHCEKSIVFQKKLFSKSHIDKYRGNQPTDFPIRCNTQFSQLWHPLRYAGCTLQRIITICVGITQLSSFAKVKTQEENFDSFPVASGYNEMKREGHCFLWRDSCFLLSSRECRVFSVMLWKAQVLTKEWAHWQVLHFLLG